MKIFINTFGSRGDVQPYIILGKALKEQNHQVMICTGSRFESLVTENGMEYGYITDDAFELLDADKTLLEDTMGILGVAKTTIKTMKIAKPINRKMIFNAWEAAKEFEPELVIYHPKALGAVSIAEKFKVPAVMISLIPMMAPTSEFPVIGMPNLNLGGWYNKLTYKLVILGYNTYMKDLNDIRIDEMGLQKLPKGTGIIAKADGTPVPIMHAISPRVLPPPQDWPDYYTMTGYIFQDNAEKWTPPAELQAFLEKGDPPVYVGFGSMSGSNPQRLTNIVVEALQQTRVRGIIATGWGGLDAANLPETIFKLEQAPHDWLFPRVTAVVHHGGAGTTAAGLRAGRPTIICPFMGDQPFWGKRVNELGIGPEPIPQKKLTVEKLAAALQAVTTNSSMREKAAVLGKQIRAEDGLANAVNIIEKLWGN
jgi:sterol 3beta-glucosyltransferase